MAWFYVNTSDLQAKCHAHVDVSTVFQAHTTHVFMCIFLCYMHITAHVEIISRYVCRILCIWLLLRWQSNSSPMQTIDFTTKLFNKLLYHSSKCCIWKKWLIHLLAMHGNIKFLLLFVWFLKVSLESSFSKNTSFPVVHHHKHSFPHFPCFYILLFSKSQL